MKKITGLEFKEFYYDEDFWADGIWCDDVLLTVNDDPWDESDEYSRIKNSDSVIIESGFVISGDKEYSMVNFFNKWKKKRSVAFITIEIDKDLLEHSVQHLKNLGYKITAKG